MSKLHTDLSKGGYTKGELQKHLKEIIWMARRYANGRMTGSPDAFNDAYDYIRENLFEGKEFEMKDPIEGMTAWPYAKYGEREVMEGKYSIS